MPTSIKRKGNWGIVIYTASIVIIILALLLPGTALAQAANYPEPQLPKPNATDMPITSIFFSWSHFYVATEEYTFQLSKNPDMSDLVIEAVIRGDSATYKYTGTPLEYSTTYWWRVIASKPLGGEWSPVSSFTTKASPAASTDNTTTTSKDKTEKSFISYLENIGWPLVGAIAGVILIVIIAMVMLIKPKPPTKPGQWQGTQPPPHMPQPFTCPACGSPNAPDRKFCSNCGGNLVGSGPQQHLGTPPPQQQTITCPACGFPNNPPERKFCGNCGSNLISGSQQPPWGAQQANYCPSCGSTNPPGQSFCNNCRANLAGGAPQQKYQVYQTFSCPICGAPINKGMNPCPNCRTWLDWGAY